MAIPPSTKLLGILAMYVMRNKKLRLSTLALVGALGLFSNQAKAQEEVFSDTIHVAPVVVETNRLKENSLDVKNSKSTTPQYLGVLDTTVKQDYYKKPIVSSNTKNKTKKKKERFGVFFGIGGLVGVYDVTYPSSGNTFKSSTGGAALSLGVEARVTGPIYIQYQFTGVPYGMDKNGEDDASPNQKVNHKLGLEAKIPLYMSGAELILGLGNNKSTHTNDPNGQGVYLLYGIGLNRGDYPWRVRFCLNSSKMKSDSKNINNFEERGGLLQFSRKF